METKFMATDLDKLLKKHRTWAIVKAHFVRETAGGQPAGRKQIEAFVEHHLKFKPGTQEFIDIVNRIEKEEIGERDTAPPDGELETTKVYGVNVIRKSDKDFGPYILEHMIKACLKVAASRLEIFTKKRGSKGDLVEMGEIMAHGDSMRDPERPWQIYLTNGNGDPVGTEFKVISGSVSTPTGKKSIKHHTEFAPEGSKFEFKIYWPPKKIKHKDMLLMLAAARKIGLGSCASLGYGRFEIDEIILNEGKDAEGE